MDFSHFAILIASAAGAGIVARIIKQPLLVGYLFAGLILGVFGLTGDTDSLEILGKVGVALLLFLVGLEMNIQELPSIGKIALITGIGQIAFTTGIGFVIASVLGFESLPALYIAIALAFSSTIIIVKLLGERKELSSLHGKIAIGFLLVQDLVAVLILMFLAGVQRGSFGPMTFVELIVKGFFLLAIVWALSKKVLPSLFTKLFDTSTELVFIVSIAWALGVAALVGGPLGFSIEIGGFLAGLALSNLPEHLQVASRTRPLRDFFLTIFFLVLGTHLVTGNILAILPTALILSALVLIGNPLIVLTLMGVLGYKKRTSFMASITVAQISEFSLIVMAMGVAVGHITQNEVALVILIAVITMTISTYMILGADGLYSRLRKALTIFERKKAQEAVFVKEELSGHLVLIGCDRTGRALLPMLKKRKVKTVVIDFNPYVIKSLQQKGVSCIFGDVTDIEILDAAEVGRSKILISTILDMHDNLTILSYIRSLKNQPAVVMKAPNAKDALKLYKHGASYVIVPEVVAGEHIRHIVKSHGDSVAMINRQGKSHQKRLEKLN